MEEENKYSLGTSHEDKDLFLASASCGWGDVKIEIKGMFAVSLLKEDFRYKNEVRLQVWGFDAKVLPSKNNPNGKRWDRIEIYLKPEQLERLIGELVMVQAKLKGGN